MLLSMPLPFLVIAGCAYVLLSLQQSWSARPVHQRPPKLHEVQVRSVDRLRSVQSHKIASPCNPKESSLAVQCLCLCF